MRRKTSKEILAESFRELADIRPIDKITIKDIVDNCGYSSATFYRQFKDKYDLIAWDYAKEVGRIMADIGVEEQWHKSLEDGAYYYQKHMVYLSKLLTYTNGYESFRRNMAEINYSHLKDYILRKTKINETDHLTDMCIRLYCHGTVELTCEWILGRVKMTTEELVAVYEKSLPEILKGYLVG
ncbi:MAG: TetR family transcriptional regulator [Lachnospiraceae bacterium]|nr:TetR family transcriptional regulator [Lachnospiraceae bacterium]